MLIPLLVNIVVVVLAGTVRNEKPNSVKKEVEPPLPDDNTTYPTNPKK